VSSTLYRGGAVLTPGVLAARPAHPARRGVPAVDPLDDAPSALLVVDGAVAWVGREDEADGLAGAADEVVHLRGGLATPGFVDAHADLLGTGLRLAAVDLGAAADLAGALAAVRAAAGGAAGRAAAAAGAPLCGYGWDEHRWAERRAPTRAEVDAAAGGAPVYLLRADLDAGVASTSFAEVLGLPGLPGWCEDGPLTGAAHAAARAAALDVGSDRRAELHAVALAAAARAGVVAVHDHGSAGTRSGLAALLARTADPGSGLPLVVGYRAELCETADDVRELAAAVPGLTGVGVPVDGPLGSRTAALRAPYADAPPGWPHPAGQLALSAEQVSNHVAAATRAGLQATFPVVGDRGLDEVLLGFRAAADVEGVDALRRAGHRIEHAAMLDAPALAAAVLLGLTAVVRPGADAEDGGPDGAHVARLGPGRAAALHPFADLDAAGVPLAFASGSRTAPFDPWAAVTAAVWHRQPDQRVAVRAALAAHTRGGWVAAGAGTSRAGRLEVGAPAHLAVWRSADADGPLGRTPLPGVRPDAEPPRCVRTVRAGVVLHDDPA
jgi:predicted amidohydrolase YtcJ